MKETQNAHCEISIGENMEYLTKKEVKNEWKRKR